MHYSNDPDLPNEQEYIEESTERKNELADCVNQNTFADVDEIPTPDGLAFKWRNKPFHALSRGDQRMIRSVITGHRREMDERLRALKRNNLLKAHERIDRMNPMLSRMRGMIDGMMDDFDGLNDESAVPVFEGQKFKKTMAGNALGKLRHFSKIQLAVKTQVDIETSIARLEEKQAATFIKEGDKTVNVGPVTPENVAKELGAFLEVEATDNVVPEEE